MRSLITAAMLFGLAILCGPALNAADLHSVTQHSSMTGFGLVALCGALYLGI